MTTKQELLEKNREKRTKCMLYTGVMGYYRFVDCLNIGREGEHI